MATHRLLDRDRGSACLPTCLDILDTSSGDRAGARSDLILSRKRQRVKSPYSSCDVVELMASHESASPAPRPSATGPAAWSESWNRLGHPRRLTLGEPRACSRQEQFCPVPA